MPTDISHVLSTTLNSTLLGESRHEELERLDDAIQETRSRLRSLLIQRQNAENQAITTVTEKAAEGFIKSLRDCTVSVSPSSGASRVALSMFEAPVRFHIMHGKYSLGNDNTVYVTMPWYSFRADLIGDGHISLKNISHIEIDGSLSAEWSSRHYSHPHVSSTFSEPSPFRGICFGTNKFLDGVNNTITPVAFLEVMRRFHIWATHANLNDMYDSHLYGNPKLSTKACELISHADELFSLALKSVSNRGLAPQLIHDVRLFGMHAREHAEAFIRAYAAWILHNGPDLSNAYGYFGRGSLMSAARIDIVSRSLDSYDFGVIEQEVFNAPMALKKMLETLEREHPNESSPSRVRLISKLTV